MYFPKLLEDCRKSNKSTKYDSFLQSAEHTKMRIMQSTKYLTSHIPFSNIVEQVKDNCHPSTLKNVWASVHQDYSFAAILW